LRSRLWTNPANSSARGGWSASPTRPRASHIKVAARSARRPLAPLSEGDGVHDSLAASMLPIADSGGTHQYDFLGSLSDGLES